MEGRWKNTQPVLYTGIDSWIGFNDGTIFTKHFKKVQNFKNTLTIYILESRKLPHVQAPNHP